MDVKLRYVYRDVLPSGTVRWRFRRDGQRTTIRGEPGSPEFLRHYAALLDGVPLDAPLQDAAAVRGSVSWLVARYLADLKRRADAGVASPLTLKGHASLLSRLVAAYGKKDANIPRGKIIDLRDTMVATPGAADNFLKAVSALYKWAIDRQMVTCGNPTRDVDRFRATTDGFVPWQPGDFDRYLATHGPGTMARRALLLAIATTARRGDLIRLGRQHEFMKEGRRWIRWKQAKAPGRMVELPMTRDLIADLSGHGDMTYLIAESGRPFSHATFGNHFRAWCDVAGVAKSLHGVRKGVTAMMPGAGADSLELDVLLGHEMGSEDTKVYVVQANRAAKAESVIDRIDRIVWRTGNCPTPE